MSRPNVILQAMSEKYEHGPEEISQKTGISLDDAAKIMKLMYEGGLLELVKDDRYKRRKKYKSKQKSLKL